MEPDRIEEKEKRYVDEMTVSLNLSTPGKAEIIAVGMQKANIRDVMFKHYNNEKKVPWKL